LLVLTQRDVLYKKNPKRLTLHFKTKEHFFSEIVLCRLGKISLDLSRKPQSGCNVPRLKFVIQLKSVLVYFHSSLDHEKKIPVSLV
jgi:hypothetical protein